MHSLIKLLAHNSHSIKFLGGSVLSSYGLATGTNNLVKDVLGLNKSLYLKREVCVGGLSFSQAIPIVEDFHDTDVIVFYFGTSVGWPRISRKLENHLRPELLESTTFHIPVYKSKKRLNRVKANIRHLERNLLKYILFPFGLYKPRHSLEDLPHLIEAIEHLAEKRASLTIWVQHNSLGYRRLWLEKRSYQKYYNEIIKTLHSYQSPHFRILTPTKKFLVQENYLLDGVHLSNLGHERMAELINQEITQAISDAKAYKTNNS